MAHEAFIEMAHFDEFHKLVCAGKSPEKLAKTMQDDWGERTDIKRDSLIRAIYRYKNDVPANQLVDGGVSEHQKKKLEDFAGDIDEVESLTKLFHLQVHRIMMAHNQESEINFLQKYTRKEIEEARNIVMALAELKIKLGVLDSQPEKFDFSFSSEKVLSSTPADEEKQLARVASQLMQAMMNPKAALESGEDVVEAEYEIEA